MSISIIFPDEAKSEDLYSYCYVEKTFPDHRKLKKKNSDRKFDSVVGK